MALLCAATASGCGLETRNRTIVYGEMEGMVEGQTVSLEGTTRLVENLATGGFASAGLEQWGPEGRVEVTLSFEEGLDSVVDGRAPGEATITAIVRTRPNDAVQWGPDLVGRVVSVRPNLTSEDVIDTTQVRGVHQHWDVAVLIDFDPDTSTALLEAEPDPRQLAPDQQLIEVTLHYDRDRVREVTRGRSAGTPTYDDC